MAEPWESSNCELSIALEVMYDMRTHLKASILGSFVCLLTACAATTESMSTEPTVYDGDWAGTIKTTSGDCKQLYEFGFTIRGGEISGAMEGIDYEYVLGGKVTSDGTLEGVNSFGPGRGNGKFEGRFTGNDQAQGHWRSESCNGEFRFTRNGSS